MKLPRSIKYILKTFKGYSVVVYYDNKIFIFRHKPFKPPEIEIKKRSENNGLTCDVVFYDEDCEINNKENIL